MKNLTRVLSTRTSTEDGLPCWCARRAACEEEEGNGGYANRSLASRYLHPGSSAVRREREREREGEGPATGEKKSATPRAVRGQKPSHASLPVPLTNTSRGTTLCANRASQRLSTRMAEQESIWGVTRRVLDFLIGKDRIGHRG